MRINRRKFMVMMNIIAWNIAVSLVIFLQKRTIRWVMYRVINQVGAYLKSGGQMVLVPGGAISAGFELSSEGGWCWFADPRAVYYNGVTYFGYVDNAGNIQIRKYTHATDTISAATTLHATLEADDHDNPTILIRDSDKRVMTFYSKHVGDTVYMRVSTNPEDISAFDAEVSLDAALGGTAYTYPSPLWTSTDSRIYLFYRNHVGGAAYWYYNVSTDGGATWSVPTPLHRQTYSKIVSNGVDRVDVACCNHPVHDDPEIYKIMHLYRYDAAWRQSDGTAMNPADEPYGVEDLTIIYDGGTKAVWIWDIAYGSDDNPVVAFAKFESVNDHRYWYGRWTGLVWDCHEICAAGGSIYAEPGSEDYYSGGVVLDHSDPTRVYCSRYVADQFEIWLYTTTDGGATWSGQAITTGSEAKQIRPVVVRDHADGLGALWLSGRYTTYVDWDVATMGYG